MLFVSRYLEPINRLKQINLFIEGLLEGLFPLFFSQGLIVLYFLELSNSPHLWSIKNYLEFFVENFEIFLRFGISSSFNLLFVALFFCLAEFILFFKLKLVLFELLIFQLVGKFSCKPSSSQTLNIKSSLVSTLLPHLTVEVHTGLDYFICALVNKEALFLHLSPNFSLYFGWFCYLIVSLSLPCKT